MISTKYYDNRTKDAIDVLRTSGGLRGREDALPPATRAVLHRWMQSVYLCPGSHCSFC